jgi:hypothetical protein
MMAVTRKKPAVKKTESKSFKCERAVVARLDCKRETMQYPGRDEVDYNGTLESIRSDHFGNIVANAGCDDCFVCTREELPEIIAFLQSIVTSSS